MSDEILTGRVASGIGQGVFFTGLDWAREQFMGKLGIEPHPGTFNMVLDEEDSMQSWVRLKRTPGVVIDNPGDGPNDCDGRCWKVSVAGEVEGAIVLPEVSGYPPAQIEIIAAVGLRDALGLEDGDPVTIALNQQSGDET